MVRSFVISLQGSKRRDVIGPALSRLQIPFEFFDGIDGRALSPDEMAAVYDGSLRTNRQLSPAEVGCALSHLAVYKRIVSEGLDGAVVFEDDAILGPKLSTFYGMLDRIPESADLVSLYSTAGHVLRRPSFTLGKFSFHKPSGPPGYSVGYFIRRRAAQVFLDANPKVTKTADWPPGYFQLRFFVTIPFAVEHDRHAPSHLAAQRDEWIERAEAGMGRGRPAYPLHDRILKKARRLHRTLLPWRFIRLESLDRHADGPLGTAG